MIPTNQNIDLVILSEYGTNEVLKQSSVSEEDIISAMKSLNWDLFHQVILSKAPNNWIEVGGNLKEDGLACIYEETGEQHVTDEPPASVEHMTKILLSYYRGDGNFKKDNRINGEEEIEEPKPKVFKKPIQRRKDYRKQEYSENSDLVRTSIITTLIIVSIGLIVYFLFLDK